MAPVLGLEKVEVQKTQIRPPPLPLQNALSMLVDRVLPVGAKSFFGPEISAEPIDCKY